MSSDAEPDDIPDDGAADKEHESYGRFAWIYDSDGNKIELGQPLPAKP
jgi:hypothetical protein